MIIDKDGRTTIIDPVEWDDDVRIFSGAKDVIRPEGVFLCRGLISDEEDCIKLMDAVHMCRANKIHVGLVMEELSSNSKLIADLATDREIEDCVFIGLEAVGQYSLIDTVDLPGLTMAGYYFRNADRMCGHEAGQIYRQIVDSVKGIR